MSEPTKILFVDDDPDIIEVNQTFLESKGYQVVAAKSAREGLEQARLVRPDVIVVDLMMEKHDAGFTLVKQLKSDPNLSSTPVLMLTAVGERTGFQFSQEEDGYWMKTDDFLEKPIPPSELMKRIELLLGQSENEGT